MSLPWEKSVTVPAEAIQLEAREAQNKAARELLYGYCIYDKACENRCQLIG